MEGSYVNHLPDEFYITGPNGRHLCLVSKPVRCSAAASRDAAIKWMFPMEVARAIAAEAALGLQVIHACGVVHGGT